jgi:hypothetical protein
MIIVPTVLSSTDKLCHKLLYRIIQIWNLVEFYGSIFVLFVKPIIHHQNSSISPLLANLYILFQRLRLSTLSK